MLPRRLHSHTNRVGGLGLVGWTHTSVLVLTSAPFSTRWSIASGCLNIAAQCIGERPCGVCAVCCARIGAGCYGHRALQGSRVQGVRCDGVRVRVGRTSMLRVWATGSMWRWSGKGAAGWAHP